MPKTPRRIVFVVLLVRTRTPSRAASWRSRPSAAGAHRNAESLFQMIEERHGKVVGLSVAIVQDWIDQAKAWKE